MRIERLDLIAFGHFTGTRLDLSEPGAVHVIYGPNEAGKSTTLRAVRALLFGIEDRTADNFMHAYDKLRLGARLVAADGSVLDVVRHKGRKNTLRDPNDEPIDEAQLVRMLSGMSQPLFASMFGLDHETLRAGAEALLTGQGDVGESLFEASVGSRSIHRLLGSLREQADELFLPRGKRKLNSAIATYKDARKRMRDEGLSAEAWLTQKQALEVARSEEQGLGERRRALRLERDGLARALTVLPLLARYRKAKGEREALGQPPPLPSDATERRLAAEAQLAEGAHLAAQRALQLEKLAGRRAELHIPESLAELGDDVIRSITDARGKHEAAQKDFPKRAQELRVIEGEVRALLRRLGRPAKLEGVEELGVDRQDQARVRALSSRGGALQKDAEHAEQDRARVSAELGRIEATLAAQPAPPDVTALVQALGSVRKLGDLGPRLDAARERAAALEARAERKRRELGLFEGTLEELSGLRLPSIETVERAGRELLDLERRAQELRRRVDEVSVALERVRREQETMGGVAAVPSEKQLEHARVLRERAFDLLRRTLREGADVTTEVVKLGLDGVSDAEAAFTQLVRNADMLADRLRREASDVAKGGALEAERASLVRQTAELQGQLAELESERVAHTSAWTELFAAASIAPLSPAEMRGWLADRERLLELAEQLDASRRERAHIEDQMAHARARLREGLSSVHREASTDGPVSELLALAEHVAAELAEARTARMRSEERLAELGEQLAQLDAELAAKRAVLAEYRESWGEAVAALGLARDVTANEALEVLDDLGTLMGKVDSLEAMRGRIAGMERDAREFEKNVRRLGDRHLYQLGDQSVEEVADELERRYHQARAAVQARAQIDADTEEAEEALAASRADDERARAELAVLTRLARVSDPSELPAVEQRVREVHQLDAELAELGRQLIDHGGGADLAGLFELTEGVEDGPTRGRIVEIDEELEASDELIRSLTADIARQEAGMRRLEQSEGAAQAALDVAELGATIRADAGRYARLRLAAVVLEREIARYRTEHQGPVLSRARELFVRLTGGAYRALEVAYEEERPSLCCISAEGREVGVELLSDGTRDQLYLALRIASLMRFADHAEPMPLVLDDILIHFDDERASAALSVLGELAKTTQVLFFTHHQHLLDLARAAVPAGQLVEHRLMEARQQALAAPV